MSQRDRMSGNAPAAVLEACCGDDFSVYADVTVNGRRIDAVAISQECGVVAVCFVRVDAPDSAPSAWPFGWVDALRDTVRVPELISVSVARTDEASLGNVLKCITVFCGSCAEDYCRQNKKYFPKSRNAYCLEGEFAERCRQAVESLRVQSLSDARQRIISGICRKLALWMFDNPGGAHSLNLTLNAKQLSIIRDDIDGTADPKKLPRYRRMRGPAGSGKTIVLVERAARLLAQGKSVCCLTYNKTAAVYLMDLLVASLESKGMHLHQVNDRLRVQHFHGLCRTVCRCPSKSPDNAHLQEWVSMVEGRLRSCSGHERFDAVMIDEGQDWRKEWWNIVDLLVAPRGEVLMSADATQNLYGRAAQDDRQWCGSHFRGPWVQLEGSYRISPDLIEPLRTFGRMFLKGRTDLPEASQGMLPGLSGTEFVWIQLPDMERLPPRDRDPLVAEVVLREFRRMTAPRPEGGLGIAVRDVACLAEKDGMCRAIAESLAVSDFAVCSSVDDKLGFHLHADAVKVSTVKSFKGLESQAVIAVVEPGCDEVKAAELYVAMSRVKAGLNSCLCVICLEPGFKEYGRTWEQCGGRYLNRTGWMLDDVLLEGAPTAEPSAEADCVRIPEHLLALIHSFDAEQGDGAGSVLDVNSNARNTASQNVQYLHTYYLRSYAENRQIFTRTLANPAVRRHFERKRCIRILAYGCGTGGDIMGTLAALSACGLTGRTIEVVAVDVNEDALDKCRELIRRAAERLGSRIEVRTVRHDAARRFRWGDYPLDFGFERLGPEKFDIIQSSKMFNELVSRNQLAYRTFLEKVVAPGLADGGLALLLDVSVTRRMTRSGKEVSEWVSRILSEQTARFLAGRREYELLMPLPCGRCAKGREGCYTAKIFSFRLPTGKTLGSVVCFRLLARSADYLKASTLAGRKMDYITLYRKSGRTESCPGEGLPRVDGYRIMDGA
ncbi:MAG TPA: hypothetical protein DEO49_05985 [Sutterella sp.]|nr:hypothetical protein [Sutterella sp.]